MQYTILGFSQTKLLEYNLSIVDAHILRWFVDFNSTGKMLKMIDDNEPSRVYSWVHYEAVLQDLPLLGINNVRVIARRFETLCECGLMKKLVKKTSRGTFSCFSLEPEAYNDLISNTTKPNTSEINDKQPKNDSVNQNSHPTVLESTVAADSNEEIKASVLKSTLAPENDNQFDPTVLSSTVGQRNQVKSTPTVPESTVATVPGSTVLIDNSSTTLTPLPLQKPASASSVKIALQKIDPTLILDAEFYPEAAGFLNSHGLEEDYLAWFYKQLQDSPNVRNIHGYFFKVFFREVFVQRYKAMSEAKKANSSEKTSSDLPEYTCPVCGAHQNLSPGAEKCTHCQTPINPNHEELKRHSALYAMDEDTRESYTFARVKVFQTGGNVVARLADLDRQYGIVS